MLKLVWAITCKADKLLIKLIHAYYIKRQSMLDMQIPSQGSHLLKKLVKCQNLGMQSVEGIAFIQHHHFSMEKAYQFVHPSALRYSERN